MQPCVLIVNQLRPDLHELGVTPILEPGRRSRKRFRFIASCAFGTRIQESGAPNAPPVKCVGEKPRLELAARQRL